MKTVNIIITIHLFIIALLLASCELENSPVGIDPREGGAPDPEITSIDPEESWLAGVDKIVISGNNFSDNPAHNFVYFNASEAMILEASPTELHVRPPKDVVGDSVTVLVAVHGALNYSDPEIYTLEPAIERWSDLLDLQRPWGIAIDADDNIYVSIQADGEDGGIKKISPDGESSDFVPRQAWFYINLRVGPDGALYGARGPATAPLIYRAPPEGGSMTSWVSGIGNIRAFDFDQNGNVWAGGNNNQYIYRITPEEDVQEFPFDHNVYSMRVYDGYLYIVAEDGGNFTIWRFQILSDDELGQAEVYFAFTNEVGGNIGAFAVTFSEDGEMFIGTDGPDAMIIVYPDRTWEIFYPGLIEPKTRGFAWGSGNDLFVVRESHGEAPDRTTQRLFRLNTQRERASYYGIE